MSILKKLRNKCNIYTTGTHHLKSHNSQKKLLDNFCKVDITSDRISLPSGTLNYIELWNKSYIHGNNSNNSNNEPSTLVLTHGYGSGLGFYFKNIEYLSTIYDRVIAIDWLGMGSSDRNSNIKNPIMWHGGNSKCSIHQKRLKNSSWCGADTNTNSNTSSMTTGRAVDFFIDSLEEFRVEKNLTSFVLAGHSLGGYLSGRYALKYPSYLKGLVLISPVGIPKPPTESVLQVITIDIRYSVC